MKKMLVSALVLLFAMVSVASAVTTIGPASSNALVPGFATSSNVTLVADGDTAGYNVTTGHLQGDTTYTSSSTNSNIVTGTKTPGVAITEVATDGATYVPGAEASGS